MPNHSRMEFTDFTGIAPGVAAALRALTKAVDDAGLEKPLTELLKLRASQINGCAFCLQFHLNLARAAGVDARKLDLLAAWRDAGIYTEREQAALAWTEALTLLGHDSASDAVYAAVSTQFQPAELAHLTAAIANINAWNRIAVSLRFSPPAPAQPRAAA
ncbi:MULTISPECIES: carboxymuconolactone decarboxylase family protein [Cupriavidus]